MRINPIIVSVFLLVCLVSFSYSQSLDDELIEASRVGHINKVKNLIEKGADVNAKDRNGNTPLRIAIINKHKDLAELLRKHGAKK